MYSNEPGIPMNPAFLSVVAHQGGWDEILLVAGPLGVIGGLLWLANRRVAAKLNDTIEPGSDPPHES